MVASVCHCLYDRKEASRQSCEAESVMCPRSCGWTPARLTVISKPVSFPARGESPILKPCPLIPTMPDSTWKLG